ncbi:hypothetical protein [Mycobacterium uberis]|uniref:hypothetical protein n=1 Tax=Mycobacterium uberis TaxID=2162698 RepID=UPI0014025AA2|nr:hypothetical protein [Mycobacterium uberis]
MPYLLNTVACGKAFFIRCAKIVAIGAPKRQHPIDSHGVTRRDKVTQSQTVRVPPFDDSLSMLPQLPLEDHQITIQLDYNLAV